MQIKNIANARRINNRCVSPICGCSCDIAACLTMSCPLCTSLVNFLWKEERHAVIPTVGSYDIDSSIGPFSQVMDSFPETLYLIANCYLSDAASETGNRICFSIGGTHWTALGWAGVIVQRVVVWSVSID
jgi:hypothetical protein